jgi:DNA-binding CsgD family transcriptional regulator
MAARRGDSDPFARLDEALAVLDPVWRGGVCRVRSARAEAWWLAGEARQAVHEVEAGLLAVDETTNVWLVGPVVFWATKLGVEWGWGGQLPEPYELYLAGHATKASAAWAALGCPYHEAQVLSDSDDEADLRRALSIFQSLGAAPAASLVARRLQAMGARGISRGPRSATRSNPAGLSNREVEVLGLLAEGLRNTEIAERLVVSTKTVDHHVSAVFAKLGVHSRHEATRRAFELGLKDR